MHRLIRRVAITALALGAGLACLTEARLDIIHRR